MVKHVIYKIPTGDGLKYTFMKCNPKHKPKFAHKWNGSFRKAKYIGVHFKWTAASKAYAHSLMMSTEQKSTWAFNEKEAKKKRAKAIENKAKEKKAEVAMKMETKKFIFDAVKNAMAKAQSKKARKPKAGKSTSK